MDPATLLGVATVLSIMVLVATLIPARRAADVQPAEALRYDQAVRFCLRGPEASNLLDYRRNQTGTSASSRLPARRAMVGIRARPRVKKAEEEGATHV